MRAVDTNIVIRLLVRDDPRQMAAADRFVARGAWVPHLVLAEVTWVLSSVYERGPEAIANAIEVLLNHQTLTLGTRTSSPRRKFRRRPALGFGCPCSRWLEAGLLLGIHWGGGPVPSGCKGPVGVASVGGAARS
jgi:hypothetical protein